MKSEFSAGGVIFKKDPSTGSGQNAFSILVAQHSQHHGWVFPKGLIGDHIDGESKEQTAIREAEEETGAKAKILKPLPPVAYWYVWEKEKIKKTVYYYVMEYLSGDITKHDTEMENVEWVRVDEVKDRLTYNADKQVWEKAKEYILSSNN